MLREINVPALSDNLPSVSKSRRPHRGLGEPLGSGFALGEALPELLAKGEQTHCDGDREDIALGPECVGDA